MGGLVLLQAESLDEIPPAQGFTLPGQLEDALVDLFSAEGRLALVPGFLIEGLVNLLRKGVAASAPLALGGHELGLHQLFQVTPDRGLLAMQAFRQLGGGEAALLVQGIQQQQTQKPQGCLALALLGLPEGD